MKKTKEIFELLKEFFLLIIDNISIISYCYISIFVSISIFYDLFNGNKDVAALNFLNLLSYVFVSYSILKGRRLLSNSCYIILDIIKKSLIFISIMLGNLVIAITSYGVTGYKTYSKICDIEQLNSINMNYVLYSAIFVTYLIGYLGFRKKLYFLYWNLDNKGKRFIYNAIYCGIIMNLGLCLLSPHLILYLITQIMILYNVCFHLKKDGSGKIQQEPNTYCLITIREYPALNKLKVKLSPQIRSLIAKVNKIKNILNSCKINNTNEVVLKKSIYFLVTALVAQMLVNHGVNMFKKSIIFGDSEWIAAVSSIVIQIFIWIYQILYYIYKENNSCIINQINKMFIAIITLQIAFNAILNLELMLHSIVTFIVFCIIFKLINSPIKASK